MSEVNEAEEDVEKGDVLRKSIGRTSERVGRAGIRAKDKDYPKLSLIMGMLNQAQTLVGLDDSKARRILGQARRMLNRG